MSDSYVGSFSGASASGRTGGSHALTQSILQSITLAGENVALANINPALATPVGSEPVSNPYAVSQLTTSSITTWLVVIVVIVVGIFAFKEL